jgi:hypothetical protein
MTRGSRRSIRVALSLSVLALARVPAGATTFTVLNTADVGAGSLRAALTSAQTCALGPHTIAFSVPGGLLTGGVAIISAATPLPSITCAGTTVDGTTQTANGGNTNDVTLGTGGTVGTGPDGSPASGDEPVLPQLNGPEVEIVASFGNGAILTVAANAVTIRGLAMHGGGDFSSTTSFATIAIQSGSGILVERNLLGSSATSYTLPVGSQTLSNHLLITGGTDITIKENLMGFAKWRTILFLSPTIGNVTIQDNEMAGSYDGVDFGNVGIGPNGTITITRNLIRDSVDYGNASTEFAFFVTQTGMTGTTAIFGNTVRAVDYGAIVDTSRPVLVQRNILSGGSGDAIRHYQGLEALTIDRNAIFDNQLGIEILGAGVNPNDGVKSVGSLNDGMDYPVITTVSLSGDMLTVQGFVGTNPGGGAAFASSVVQLFKADNDPANQRGDIVGGDTKNAGHGEGATFLGSTTVDALGSFDTTFALPTGVTLLAGDPITGTATDVLGNTSEFGGNAHVPIVFDIDANGSTDALTDGLLVLRHLFGFTGSTLINNAVGPGCARCTANDIASHLVELDFVLDIDKNNDLAALSDGLLVLRYLFGFSGATLTGGAVGPGCGRCDAAAITPYLQSLDN